MADAASVFAGTALYDAVLNRMNITWDPDTKTLEKVLDAMEEAQMLLRSYAGNYELTFEEGEHRGLFIVCTWYLAENKRADFEADYSGELINLRMTEGFGCGKEAESAV